MVERLATTGRRNGEREKVMKLARRNLFRGVCAVLLGRAVGPERAVKAIALADVVINWNGKHWIAASTMVAASAWGVLKGATDK